MILGTCHFFFVNCFLMTSLNQLVFLSDIQSNVSMQLENMHHNNLLSSQHIITCLIVAFLFHGLKFIVFQHFCVFSYSHIVIHPSSFLIRVYFLPSYSIPCATQLLLSRDVGPHFSIVHPSPILYIYFITKINLQWNLVMRYGHIARLGGLP